MFFFADLFRPSFFFFFLYSYLNLAVDPLATDEEIKKNPQKTKKTRASTEWSRAILHYLSEFGYLFFYLAIFYVFLKALTVFAMFSSFNTSASIDRIVGIFSSTIIFLSSDFS